MRTIRLSFFQMLKYLRRDMMLLAACIAPILIGLLIRFAIPLLEAVLTEWFHKPAIISRYYALIDVLFSMLTPIMFCFVSAMVVLEESDEKTAKYLFITPLGKLGYLAARFGVPAVIAFFVTVILLPVFDLTTLSPIAVLLLAAGGTLQGIIAALLVLTLSSNKLEGMAVTKLSMLPVLGLVIPFFIKGSMQYVLSLLPSFWIGKAFFEKSLIYMLPAFPLSFAWVFVLLKRYLRKI